LWRKSGRGVVPSHPASDDHHKIPESFSAFWRIVSFTAAKTRRIFDVSVACVRLENR
jgi:hypothetical protein